MELFKESNERDLLIDQVYTRVLANILERGIANTGKINIGAIAKNIGVSRTPVNTVMFALEKEGIVSRDTTNGWISSVISRSMVLDTFNILYILFPIMVAESTQRISASHTEIINTFVMEIKRSFILKDWSSLYLADNGYLRLIMANAESNQLKRIIQNLWMQLARLRNGYYRIYGMRDSNWKNYELLSDSIISGRTDQATEQAKEFILVAKKSNLEFFDNVILHISI